MKPETYYVCDDCYSAFPSHSVPYKTECPDCGTATMMPVPGFRYEKNDKVVVKTAKEMREAMPGDAHYLEYDELDPGYDPDMENYAGKETFVTDSGSYNWLDLNCDKGEWCWSPLWVKPYESKSTKALKSCLNDDLFEL